MSEETKDLFDKDFLETIGFTVVSDDGVYGKAESKRPKGKRLLSWNREGRNIDYFGEPIEHGAHFGIKEDGGTRTCFSGIVRSREQIILLNDLCF